MLSGEQINIDFCDFRGLMGGTLLAGCRLILFVVEEIEMEKKELSSAEAIEVLTEVITDLEAGKCDWKIFEIDKTQNHGESTIGVDNQKDDRFTYGILGRFARHRK